MRAPPGHRARRSSCSGRTRAQSRESRHKSASRVAQAAGPPPRRKGFVAQSLSLEFASLASVVAKASWTIASAAMGTPGCNCENPHRAPVGIRGTSYFGNDAYGGGCGKNWGAAGVADGRGSFSTPGERRKTCRQGIPLREYVSRRKAVKPRCAHAPWRYPQAEPSLFEVASSPVFEDVELVISAQDTGVSGTEEGIFIEVIDGQPRGGQFNLHLFGDHEDFTRNSPLLYTAGGLACRCNARLWVCGWPLWCSPVGCDSTTMAGSPLQR